MKYTYAVFNKEGNLIKRTNQDTGEVSLIPVDPSNMDYYDILTNKITPDPYVAPTDTAPILTVQQKLSAIGLTPDDIKQALNIATTASV